tara:strand:+ start:267 stop:581 length:315 start_codon:yes stop_codon:yes gene_type:complete
MTKQTKVIFHNGKNTDNGYLIKNPYATVQTFNTEDGQVKIPVYSLLRIFSMLYVGERTGHDSSFLRSGAVKALNQYFKCKHNYKTWREKLRPLYESEYYNRKKR